MKRILVTTLLAATTLSGIAASGVKNAVVVGKAEGTKISKAKLMEDMNLHLTTAYNGYTINSYELSYLPKGGEVQGPRNVLGSKFSSNELLEMIGKIKEGDRLYFENITLTSADGKVLTTNAAVEVQ